MNIFEMLSNRVSANVYAQAMELSPSMIEEIKQNRELLALIYAYRTGAHNGIVSMDALNPVKKQLQKWLEANMVNLKPIFTSIRTHVGE